MVAGGRVGRIRQAHHDRGLRAGRGRPEARAWHDPGVDGDREEAVAVVAARKVRAIQHRNDAGAAGDRRRRRGRQVVGRHVLDHQRHKPLPGQRLRPTGVVRMLGQVECESRREPAAAAGAGVQPLWQAQRVQLQAGALIGVRIFRIRALDRIDPATTARRWRRNRYGR